MNTLLDTYREDDDEEEGSAHLDPNTSTPSESTDPPPVIEYTLFKKRKNSSTQEPGASDDLSEDEQTSDDNQDPGRLPKPAETADNVDDDDDPPPKKQKQLSSLTAGAVEQELPTFSGTVVNDELDNSSGKAAQEAAALPVTTASSAKKSKKKSNNVWNTKSKKGKKKSKANNNHNAPAKDTVRITPVPRFADKGDDNPDMEICLSKVYKAEKMELSDDRRTAGSSKGYRMVRATRGVQEGAWYFEIKVMKLGETGHTRLGWSTEKGDLHAPVGYDANSFAYRDIDGSKVHKALREKYGEGGYKEGDVIGFYINLPDGSFFAPKSPHLVWYKGQRYMCAPDPKEDPPKSVPGSEITFFRNGVSQGVAFTDMFGGRYYPAASMYTFPNQPNCVVKFNFGPNFEFFPDDFNGRPIPRPMAEVPYHVSESCDKNGLSAENKQ